MAKKQLVNVIIVSVCQTKDLLMSTKNLSTVVHARAGLLGNPSDGYFGKTISCLISNFSAKITLQESEIIELLPHPSYDPMDFPSLSTLAKTIDKQGYYGGLRIMLASCKRFYQICTERGIQLDAPNFTVRYETTIPREVGMAGSSAIVIAIWRSLINWYGVGDKFQQTTFPQLALDTELIELGITAGLQDRVIQTYGGVMYMDFDRQYLTERGYGEYIRMPQSTIPPLFVAYVLDPSESGFIHSDVKRRWNEGEKEVRDAMLTFASFAEEGREAMLQKNYDAIREMQGKAFALRRKIFGDNVLGKHNLRMVEIVESFGLCATTCGSGGAIAGVMADPDKHTAMAKALNEEGYRCMTATIGPDYEW